MRIVVKVGTSTLAHPGGLLNIRHTEDLVRVWSDIQNAGHQLIVVSSAATGLGAGKLQIEKPGDLVTKQAAAAVGQCELMYTYDRLFGQYNHTVAQMLLTWEDFDHENRLHNLQNTLERLLQLHAIPIINEKIKERARTESLRLFGGNIKEVIIGGAPFNAEVEAFVRSINFPYSIAYGMTECGPIICYEDWTRFKPGSCGKAAPRMEVKILSSDPENIPGEIVCRGPNVMLGYYKNDEATVQVLDKDGWLHTGDLALMDAEGNVSIKGRSKNMLLGPSGQNIYPEEIEDKLNNMPYVAESIIVQQNEKLVGLVYPDFDDAFAHGLNNDDIERVMEENRVALNAELPAYSQIFKMKIYPEEFEKTPKKSIKRFLYQEAKG